MQKPCHVPDYLAKVIYISGLAQCFDVSNGADMLQNRANRIDIAL